MKKQSKFTLHKIKDFLTENTSIIVILLVLFSLISLMMINGFKIEYESLDTDPPSSVLVEDRVPALALYYQRDRINVNIILADPSELDEGEVLENIVYEARYNSYRRFDEAFANNIVPNRENYLFTHFSLTPNGAPLDPAERITEEITVYANWVPKTKVQPYQVLVRVTYQIELGIGLYMPYFYEYHVVNKGFNDYITVEEITGLYREDYKVKVRVDGKETKQVIDVKADYTRLERCNVTFNLNGGKLPVITQKTVYSIPKNGLIIEFPGVSKEDNRFLGWSLTPNGDVLALQDVLVVTDITLYATFEKSIAKPNSSSGQGRYLTSYYIESINYKDSPVLLMTTDNIGDIDSEIEAKKIDLSHFSEVNVDKYSHKSMILGAQFLFVPKKDKVFALNQKVMSFTETNPIGIIVLILMFGVLAWTFVDNRSNNMKFLGWGIILLVAGILVLVLPQLVKFSVYFKNIWEISKVLNPDGTKISSLIGIKLSGSLLLIAAVFSFTTFIISFITNKKEKQLENN